MARKPKHTPEQVEAALDRWRSKLKYAFGAVERYEQEKKRMERAKRPRGHADISDLAGTIGPAIRESIKDQKVIGKPVTVIGIAAPERPADDKLEIPTFLKREKPKVEDVSDISWSEMTGANLRDTEARIAIETENANRRIAKSRARISKMKAKKAGDLKKMPLSGKAALAHIRNG
jgi:hypothetical protein